MSSAWLILIVGFGLFLAVVYGFYTRRGSGISQRPYDPERGDAASGAAGPSRISSAKDETEGIPDTHGTR